MAAQRWFWLKWPPHKQQQFFRVVKWGWLFILFASFGPQYFLTVDVQKQIARKKDLYTRVVPVATELRSVHLRQAAFQEVFPRKVVAESAERAGIGRERVFFDENRFEFADAGVQVTLSEVTLVELTSFLKSVRDTAELHFFEFQLERNPDNFMLADVSMILVK